MYLFIFSNAKDCEFKVVQIVEDQQKILRTVPSYYETYGLLNYPPVVPVPKSWLSNTDPHYPDEKWDRIPCEVKYISKTYEDAIQKEMEMSQFINTGEQNENHGKYSNLM